jgi:hypothetical protein
MPESASASRRLLVIAKMRADLSAYGSAIFSYFFSDLGKTFANGERSLDEQSVIICEMFHG